MGHHITALVLKGDYNKQKAESYDLQGLALGYGLHLFFVNYYYSAYWQHELQLQGLLPLGDTNGLILPTELVLAHLMQEISGDAGVEFALIATDYFGGVGDQVGNVFKGLQNADLSVSTINQALRHLGLQAQGSQHGYANDEFDTVGLGNYRSNPIYLDKYGDFCDALGL